MLLPDLKSLPLLLDLLVNLPILVSLNFVEEIRWNQRGEGLVFADVVGDLVRHLVRVWRHYHKFRIPRRPAGSAYRIGGIPPPLHYASSYGSILLCIDSYTSKVPYLRREMVHQYLE